MTDETGGGGKAIVIGSLALLLPTSQIVLLGSPRPWAPFPIVLVFPVLGGVPWPLVVAAPSVAFLVAMAIITARARRPPLGSFVSAMIVALLHLWWLIEAWPFGLRWQGAFHTAFVGVASVMTVVPGLSLLFSAWRRTSARMCYWGHLAFFAWLSWMSFPYLGEMP